MRNDVAQWPLPLQCFMLVFGLGYSLHGLSILCRFCDYKLFWSLGYGLARFELGYSLPWERRRSKCIERRKGKNTLVSRYRHECEPVGLMLNHVTM